ncbi:MAG: hypothetical protein ACREHD_25295, partial [Pirellulales bacterium]
VWLWGSLAVVSGSAEEVSANEQNVAALPPVGSLADSAVVQVELRPDAPPSVAALPPVGSLAAGSEEASGGEQNVATLPAVGSLAGAGGPAEAVPAATASDGGGDRAEQSESASDHKRRLRRERRFIERTLRICRDG